MLVSVVLATLMHSELQTKSASGAKRGACVAVRYTTTKRRENVEALGWEQVRVGGGWGGVYSPAREVHAP